ncbi:acetyl-CoA carboxylase biotin carboxyl carrier protein subunit [Allomuricauda sp. d1]|uniref:acetyl-CoA carboxylase biotin carboxyl carrier protein subunit n=1 Tax=Allomuricauda sp. d1 TaxID=3136725 RepID=UPI0031D85DC0
MEKKYKLKVNNQYEFQLAENDLKSLDSVKTGTDSLHILENNQSYHVSFVSEDFNGKTYQVKVNNTSYVVEIANPLDLLINEMGFALNSASLVSSIEAPMPGLILEVPVAKGQEVQEGDALLILEAMKMENTITSPRNGIIKSITVKQGQAVEKKQTLITFE